ncbi:alpha/beta hydrolase [Pareuzebyella sediminis]|uniref:alpha/beta hydrolase n=1 Tax=Pareuzebyella sediminis TaxID=2607998 RepID=UPI0011ECD5A6|nr:alpha/beta hydrolase [Pareuzebyella sediminis]
MEYFEKKVTYKTTNTYATLNSFTKETKNIWVVLHGIGYLSRYFLRHFDELPTNENYIIAPQAPSKYYLGKDYRNVGASWLTKENTVLETQNVIAYLDALKEEENLESANNLIVLGFSQGVSVAMRWLAKSQLNCHHLVLYAGGIPKELKPSDFDFLLAHKTKITSIVGDKDEYLTRERQASEASILHELFKGRAERLTFDGGHEIKKEILEQLIS